MFIKRTIGDDNGAAVKETVNTFKVWDDEKGYLFRSRNFFVKQFNEFRLSEFVPNKTDYANLHILAENIYKDTNMIATRIKKKVHPADIIDISNILDLRERTAREFIDRMMQKGLIAKAVVNCEERIETHYFLNPLFFMSNKYLSPFLYMLFRNQLEPFLKPWALQMLNEAANLKDKIQKNNEFLGDKLHD